MSNPALRVDRLGSGWMVVSAALFALMGAFAKAAGSRFGFSFNELVFWRMLFGLFAIGLPEWWRGHAFRTPYLKSHLNRSITGSVALLLSFALSFSLCFYFFLVQYKMLFCPFCCAFVLI